MLTMLQVIDRARVICERRLPVKTTRIFLAWLMALTLICAPELMMVRAQTTTQPTSSLPQTTQPAGTTQTQQQPGAPSPTTQQLPPNSSSAPLRPGNEAQQSTQPQTGVQQERQQTTPGAQAPRPTSPQVQPPSQQIVPGQPQTSTPAGTVAPANGVTPNATTNPNAATGAIQLSPGQNVGVSSGIAPAQLPADPPPIAPNFKAPPRPLPSAERVGVDMGNQMSLSLNDAIGLALQNNNDIDGSRINVQIAEYELTAARGLYDPIFSSENYFERRTTPTSSTIGGGQNGSVTQTDGTGAVRLGGFTPFAGGSYQLDFSSTRLTTNNQFVALNPQFPAALTFTYTQPLLRGLRFDLNRRTIEIAKKNLSLSDAQFRQRAIEVISQVEQGYWDLVFALKNLQVQIDAVKQARVQVESNQRLVEKGVLAPIDIVAASTQVTTFEQSVYSAQEAVTRAENTLKTLILPERTSALWSRPLTPVTPVSLEAPRIPLEQALTAALDNRPELAQIRTSAEINQIDTKYYRDQTKPQIDLIGTYTAAGLSGTAVPASQVSSRNGTNAQLVQRVNDLSALASLPPLDLPTTPTNTLSPNLIGPYQQSLANLFGQDYPTYRVGVRVAIPLRNRTAEAYLGRSLAQGSGIRNQRAQQEQLIEADVRNASQTLRSAEARLASAAASRSSAEQQYDSEQRQFRAGTTTVFLVLQRQNELLAARGQELQAQTDLNKAIADFQRATGITLQANNVAVRTDTPTRELEMRPAASSSIAPGAASSSASALSHPSGAASETKRTSDVSGIVAHER